MTKLVVTVSSYFIRISTLTLTHSFVTPQIAILQLLEQGKITYETPVGDIIPEMANPIVLEDITKELSSFKPAVTKITLKHLLNHTSGLVYRVKPPKDENEPLWPYQSKAYGENRTVSQFFKLIQVGVRMCWMR